MKTYLPLFTGFYNTIWEMDDSYLIEEENIDMENNEVSSDNTDTAKQLSSTYMFALVIRVRFQSNKVKSDHSQY